MAGLRTLILVTLRHVTGRILNRQSRKNYGAVNIAPATKLQSYRCKADYRYYKTGVPVAGPAGAN